MFTPSPIPRPALKPDSCRMIQGTYDGQPISFNSQDYLIVQVSGLRSGQWDSVARPNHVNIAHQGLHLLHLQDIKYIRITFFFSNRCEGKQYFHEYQTWTYLSSLTKVQAALFSPILALESNSFFYFRIIEFKRDQYAEAHLSVSADFFSKWNTQNANSPAKSCHFVSKKANYTCVQTLPRA